MIILEYSRLQNSCCLRRHFFEKHPLRRVENTYRVLGNICSVQGNLELNMSVWLQPFMVTPIPNLPQLSTAPTQDRKVLQNRVFQVTVSRCFAGWWDSAPAEVTGGVTVLRKGTTDDAGSLY